MPDIRITVRVKPGSSRLRVGGSHGPGRELIVAVNAAPVDGAANEAVIRAVAKAFGLRPRQVTLVSGQTARTKTLALSIDDGDAGVVASRLAELLEA